VKKRLIATWLFWVICGWLSQSLSAQTKPHPAAERVLVVKNLDSPTSVELADYYLSRRGLSKVLAVHCQDSATQTAQETMPFATFRTQIETPLRAYLKSDERIDFIVLTKGTPIRLTDAPLGLNGKQPSVDSFIAALDYPQRKDAIALDVNDSGITGKCYANRFWNSKERFTHERFGGYLVTRLDGYTLADAKALVDRSIRAETQKPSGSTLIDVAPGRGMGDLSKVPRSPVNGGVIDRQVVNEFAYGDWNADQLVAGRMLRRAKLPVFLDESDKFIGREKNLMGYCSWGSNDPKFNADNYHSLQFADGGIAETAVSTSGRTFLPAAGGQSLIADLIGQGATGVKGYCDEPLLQAIASPTILFDRYTRGWTLAESYYAASRFVGWEDIVIGDPLCQPYGR
jgi:uncharacterized protein (TIGR03790 family)